MSNAAVVRQRNQSMEYCKLIASFFVVFLHVPFPGAFGKVVCCLARFAVPMFFAISGYFSFQASPRKLAKRFGRILLLELAGIVLHVLWRCFQEVYWGGDLRYCLTALLPQPEALVKWLLLNVDPYAGHLWYLSAAAACYGILWAYSHFFPGYRPLYILSACLLAAHFAMAEFSGLLGISVDFPFYRNAVFFGLPMFVMGIALREYRERILNRLAPAGKTLALLLAGGVALSLAERQIFGPYDLHIGTVVTAAALILLTTVYPKVRLGSGIPGSLSTTIYLIHLIVYDACKLFVPVEGTWLMPILTVLLSLLAAVAWEAVKSIKKQ